METLDERLLTDARYRPQDVARLTGVPATTVRRWLSTSPSHRGKSGVVVRAGETPVDYASFLDLVEIELVRQVRARANIGSKRLRDQLHEAARVLRVSHPLARYGVWVERVRDGGRAALCIRVSSDDEGHLLHLGHEGQMALSEIMSRRSEYFDYTAAGLAFRWHPAGRESPIVLDVERGYGAPTIRGTRIAVESIIGALRFAGVERVADQYNLQAEQVRAAVDFARDHRMAA